MKTAILVDGGFYRKRARYLYGELTAEKRANELECYCRAHISARNVELYRIFYYDCMPISKTVYNPLTRQNMDFGRSETYAWMNKFLEELKRRRKFALRLGELSDAFAGYSISPAATKALLSGRKTIEGLTAGDLHLDLGHQKGVDMKIGIDIASLAYKQQVEQIILIAGDSDFVPAAKLARREGIDFILDPMGAIIKASLFEHIDGLNSPAHWSHKPISKATETDNKAEIEFNEVSKETIITINQ